MDDPKSWANGTQSKNPSPQSFLFFECAFLVAICPGKIIAIGSMVLVYDLNLYTSTVHQGVYMYIYIYI